jgi:hypothetical protein
MLWFTTSLTPSSDPAVVIFPTRFSTVRLDSLAACKFITVMPTIVSIQLGRSNNESQAVVEPQQSPGDVASGEQKPKRKKLKGKRAVTRFLKSLRWKKKRGIQRMTAEEKILYKLKLVSCIAMLLCFQYSSYSCCTLTNTEPPFCMHYNTLFTPTPKLVF